MSQPHEEPAWLVGLRELERSTPDKDADPGLRRDHLARMGEHVPDLLSDLDTLTRRLDELIRERNNACELAVRLNRALVATLQKREQEP